LGELGAALGRGIREFRKEVSTPDKEEEKEKTNEE